MPCSPLRDVSNSTSVNSIIPLETLALAHPPGWQISNNADTLEMSLLANPSTSVIKLSVKTRKNLRWEVRVYDNALPVDSKIYDELPTLVTSTEFLNVICSTIQSMNVCEGNRDDFFIEMIRNKGGEIKKNETVMAFFDESSNCIRHSKCHLISKEASRRCSACQSYRSTLRAMKSRCENSNPTASTSHNSHTNYRYLSNKDLATRLKNVQAAKRAAVRSASRLNGKLQAMIEKEGIDLGEEDASDMEELMGEVDESVKAKKHFRCIFWKQQQVYHSLDNKRRMRWHPLMIRFALNLKYLSNSAYRAVGNFIALPSKRTLCDYTNVLSVEPGVSNEVIQRMISDMKLDSCTDQEKLVGLMMDETKVKSGLVFSKRTDRLVGFVNLGSINSNLEALQSSLGRESLEQTTGPELAGSMLVFMARLLHRPSFTFPVAQYATCSLSGAKLYPMVWDVLEALEMNGLKVMSISCDGLSANRKFFGIGRDPEHTTPRVPYKTTNPFDTARNIYYFSDVPHLLKTARNCFSNSFGHSKSRNLKV